MTEDHTIDVSLLAEMDRKIDALAAQVAMLTEEAARQRSRQQEWDDLKSDLVPVSKEAFGVVVRQLEEVEHCVRMENILHLAKRMMRNTCNFEQLLDMMEALMGFWEDFGPLGREVFLNVMHRLDEMERKGYFAFFKTLAEIGDETVTSFSSEDLQNLRRSVPPLVEMARDVAKPEMAARLQRSVAALGEDESKQVSLFGLLRQMNDPAVRRGMSRTLSALKAMAE